LLGTWPHTRTTLSTKITKQTGALGGCLLTLLGRAPESEEQVPLAAAARADALQARVGVAFDAEDAAHAAALRDLWRLACPGQDWPGARSEAWKALGWQSADPTSDLRAAGVLALDVLVHFGRARPQLFAALVGKDTRGRGRRSEWEYPFAAASVNVLWSLAQMLGLDVQQSQQSSQQQSQSKRGRGGALGVGLDPRARRGFMHLLASDDSAFEELCCAALEALDDEWLARGATYMEFNAVWGDVRRRIARALAARPASVGELRRAIGLAAEEGDTG
jgi:hypothetical protein